MEVCRLFQIVNRRVDIYVCIIRVVLLELYASHCFIIKFGLIITVINSNFWLRLSGLILSTNIPQRINHKFNYIMIIDLWTHDMEQHIINMGSGPWRGYIFISSITYVNIISWHRLSEVF